MSLRSRPLRFRHFNVSFPDERIVQVTLNRPEKLNCIDKATSREIAEIWELFDRDESLWVGIITGVGRAFCTGADLYGKASVRIAVFSILGDEECLQLHHAKAGVR
jgi:mevalonyl-CoA hydratase